MKSRDFLYDYVQTFSKSDGDTLLTKPLIISSAKPYHEQSNDLKFKINNLLGKDGDRQGREVKSEVKLAILFFFLVVIILFFFLVDIVGVG